MCVDQQYYLDLIKLNKIEIDNVVKQLKLNWTYVRIIFI